MPDAHKLRRDIQEFDTSPSTIDAAIDALANLHEMASACLDVIDDRDIEIGDKDDELRGVKDELLAATEQIEAAMQDSAADIEAARQLIKQGRTEDAIYVLDRVLQEIDPTCTRVGVVVTPRLPAAGGFL